MLDMIGDRLKELRVDAGLSQPEFAAVVGTSKQYVSQLERGVNKIPNGTFLEEWARHFGVSHRWLVSGNGPRWSKDLPISEAASELQQSSQSLRLDPEILAETANLLRVDFERRGLVYSIKSIEDDPETFIKVYTGQSRIRTGMTMEQAIALGELPSTPSLAPQGAKDSERGKVVPRARDGKGDVRGRGAKKS